MIICRIDNCTRILGIDQNYLGLPIRDELTNDLVNDDNTPCMISAWEPTPEELNKLNKGSKVYLKVLGTLHPPVMLSVE